MLRSTVADAETSSMVDRAVHANLTAAEQHYIGGWSNVGPNNLFRAVLLHPSGRVP